MHVILAFASAPTKPITIIHLHFMMKKLVIDSLNSMKLQGSNDKGNSLLLWEYIIIFIDDTTSLELQFMYLLHVYI